MRFGIVGAGKMGAEIEEMASRRGHDVVWKLDSRENAGGAALTPEKLSGADVVFEFTHPAAAPANLTAMAAAGATVVCGTTGWERDLPRITQAFRAGGGALVHAANFSVGVALSAGGIRALPGRGTPRRKEGRAVRHRAEDRRNSGVGVRAEAADREH